MDLLVIFRALIMDYTLRTVTIGVIALGITSGALGCFAVLRKKSLFGDAIAHAALPGIVLAFLITGSKASWILTLGAAGVGWVATVVIMVLLKHSKLKEDSSLGLVLSVFFGAGLVLLTLVQKLPDANQAGLDRFLFGQAAALMTSDVILIVTIGGLSLLVMSVWWKEFKIVSFDPEYARSIGISVVKIELLQTGLLVLAVVVGLQAVGVILMSAMIVGPAVAARQWTDRLGRMIVVAAGIGALSGLNGVVSSSLGAGIATGPTIVIWLSGFVMLSLLFAPNRGLLWNWQVRRKQRKSFGLETTLIDLYTLALHHGTIEHGHPVTVLQMMRGGSGAVDKSLKLLQERGWVRQIAGGWLLTETGTEEAKRVVANKEVHNV